MQQSEENKRKHELCGKIGLIADSHSINTMLLKSLDIMEKSGVQRVIHLGDICDSQNYEPLDEAVEILKQKNVSAVCGNNECFILTEKRYNRYYNLKKHSVEYIEKLPYNFFIEDICFTHSLPFSWPAATRYPIDDYISVFASEKNPTFRIMFRGHSHVMSIIEISNYKAEKKNVSPGETIQLDFSKRYIISVGALEDGIYAIFDPETNVFTASYISN